jgi:hypothetical protein
MKHIILLLTAYFCVNSAAPSSAIVGVHINRITRVDDYGQMFRCDSIYYWWGVNASGSNLAVDYSYGLPDTTGNDTFKAPYRRRADITIPVQWNQLHPDSIRNVLLRQLNLTLKP